jgi:hypothetical protein
MLHQHLPALCTSMLHDTVQICAVRRRCVALTLLHGHAWYLCVLLKSVVGTQPSAHQTKSQARPLSVPPSPLLASWMDQVFISSRRYLKGTKELHMLSKITIHAQIQVVLASVHATKPHPHLILDPRCCMHKTSAHPRPYSHLRSSV